MMNEQELYAIFDTEIVVDDDENGFKNIDEFIAVAPTLQDVVNACLATVQDHNLHTCEWLEEQHFFYGIALMEWSEEFSSYSAVKIRLEIYFNGTLSRFEVREVDRYVRTTNWHYIKGID